MSSEFAALPKAPIVEAILDIRFSVPRDLSESELMGLAESLREDRWIIEERRHAEARIRLGSQSDGISLEKTSGSLDAVLIRDDPATKVIQIKRNAYAVSVLHGYRGWPEFENASGRHFDRIARAMEADSVVRVSCRFLNRFSLGRGKIDLDDYFENGPSLPDFDGLVLSHVNQHFQFVDEGLDTHGSIRLASNGWTDGCANFLLDIDVAKAVTLPPRFDELGDAFQKIRATKNRLFFGYLKDKTLEQFK